MPALAFLAVVGLALVALLFVADATLESGSPPIVTSDARRSAGALASKYGRSSHHHAGACARHVIEGCPRCPAV